MYQGEFYQISPHLSVRTFVDNFSSFFFQVINILLIAYQPRIPRSNQKLLTFFFTVCRKPLASLVLLFTTGWQVLFNVPGYYLYRFLYFRVGFKSFGNFVISVHNCRMVPATEAFVMVLARYMATCLAVAISFVLVFAVISSIFKL